MTIEEAIRHAEEVAEEKEKDALHYTYSIPHAEYKKYCEKCAEEHRQFAEWVTDYKRLKEQPTGDLISRQAVQDYITKYLSQYLYNDVREAVETIDEYIGELPSAEKTEWIPVSEGLPKNKEIVIISYAHFISGDNVGLGSMVLLHGKPHWHILGEKNETNDVRAWMPLPKPYKDGGE